MSLSLLALLCVSGVAGAQHASVGFLGPGAGTPCPAINSTLPVFTMPLTIFVSNAPPNSPMVLAITMPPPLPLFQLAPGSFLWITPFGIPEHPPFFFPGFTNGQGMFSITFPADALNGFPAGSVCNTQAFVLNPGPGSMTFPAPFDFFTGFATAGLALTMGDPPPMVTPSGPQPSTYSKGEYGGNGPAGQLLVGTFAFAFPNGVEVGDYNTMMGACPPNGLLWTFSGLNSLRTYLLGGGTMSGSFDADALNPSVDFGGGPFGRNVVALALNIRFHELGLLGGTPGDFGHLMYIDPGSSMHMHTVNEIFAETQQAIAGFSLPPGYSFVALAQLIENLNLSFHNAMPSMWAGMHLFAPGP